MNKKILIGVIGFVAVVAIFGVILLTNKNNDEFVEDNAMLQDDQYEQEELAGDRITQKVSLLTNEESNESIEIIFDTERFTVEEYYLMEPQTTIDFIDKRNGNNYTVRVNNISGYTVEDFYNKLVNNAKRNTKAEDFKATEMIDVNYGGINFKKFTVSWSEAYEYNTKETGELVSGVSNEEETAVFAELEPGVFLVYEGLNDEETLNDLFVKITK